MLQISIVLWVAVILIQMFAPSYLGYWMLSGDVVSNNVTSPDLPQSLGITSMSDNSHCFFWVKASSF